MLDKNVFILILILQVFILIISMVYVSLLGYGIVRDRFKILDFIIKYLYRFTFVNVLDILFIVQAILILINAVIFMIKFNVK